MPGSWTPLQERVLLLLGAVRPQPVLFGGAALSGVWLGHRQTRDLDLLWQPCSDLSDISKQVELALFQASLPCTSLQRSPWHHRLQVRSGSETLVLDLVAHPGATDRLGAVVPLGQQFLLVLTPQQILADKLTALLGRQEGRDLFDVHALLQSGCDLRQAVDSAADLDGGFSILTLAWVLRTWQMPAIAAVAGWDSELTREMAAFRDVFVQELVGMV
jgi:hypothetical protein